MRRTILQTLLVVAALVTPTTAAQAEPTAATLALDVTIGCFGCGTHGPSGNSLSGIAVAGEGAFLTGAPIGGDFTVNDPGGVSCLTSGTLVGTMTTDYGYAPDFTLARTGTTLSGTVDGMAATGTFTLVGPVGNPCVQAATAKVTLTVLGDRIRFPRAKGHVTIHRFPGTPPLLLAHPVAQNGTPWSCRDVNTNQVVVQGDALSAPDPGVECYPPGGYNPECVRLVVGGYFAAAGTSDSIRTTAQCSSASLSVDITPTAPVPSQMSRVHGGLPLRCTVDESLVDPSLVDYWTFCDVNAA